MVTVITKVLTGMHVPAPVVPKTPENATMYGAAHRSDGPGPACAPDNGIRNALLSNPDNTALDSGPSCPPLRVARRPPAGAVAPKHGARAGHW